MSRNVLYLLVGALAVAVAVLGYSLYQESREPSGVQIELGEDGVKIESQ